MTSAPSPAGEISEPTLSTRPLGAAFGVEILDVDLSASLDDAQYHAVYSAFLRHQLIVFRNQTLPPEQHVALGRRFGEVQVHVMDQYHADGYPELYYLSNLDENGKPGGAHPDKGTLAWHTDGSWRRVTGQATMLYAVEVPSRGGETHFCDMYAAYAGLDGNMKDRLEGLRAVHNLDFSRSRRHREDPMSEEQQRAAPPVDHPVVRTHPDSGRRCLFLGDHAEYIEDEDYGKGRELIETVNRLAVRPENVYRHRWQPGDLLIWDNRCLMHRATAYDTTRERRVMRRCTILGDVPV
jgi:taurine dioxygenase